MRTTSTTEFLFVYDPRGEGETRGLEWPRETHGLRDADMGRKRRPISELEQVARRYSAQLEAANQPPLLLPETVAANLYAGPVRVHARVHAHAHAHVHSHRHGL